MSRPAERVVAFYNKRGTCEQWIKEGKGAIKWTPNVRRQRGAAPASCARLQPRQFPAHAGDAGADQGRSLTTLKDKLIKIGAKVVSHGRYVDFAAHRGATAAATTSASVRRSMSFQEQPTEGVRPNARENGQIRPSTKRSGLPEVPVAVSTSRLSCKRAGKTRTLMPVWDSSGESRSMGAKTGALATQLEGKVRDAVATLDKLATRTARS
jgi:hypothetical protein